MRDALIEILDKTDLVVATCREVVSDESLESFVRVSRNVRVRLSYPEGLLVTALAGGTGSGKSSLLNAIAGEEVAEVGGVRPTTDSPLAVIGSDQVGLIDGYLRGLNIASTPVDDFPDWLVLIDLPDTDSVEVAHRHQVETLLPRVDVIVWVSDPEKYRDAVLHERFVRPFADYGSRFQFVLNQTDRIAEESIEEVLADFATALREDSVDDPHPIAVSASPAFGPPQGIEILLAALKTMIERPQDRYSKLVIDLERAVADLERQVGGEGVDFDPRFGGVVANASGMIVNDEIDAAVSALTRFVEDLAIETGGPVGQEIRAVAVDLPDLVQDTREILAVAVVEHRKALHKIRWSEKGDSMSPETRLGMVGAQLSETLGPALREPLSRRAHASAALADLSLSLTSHGAGRR